MKVEEMRAKIEFDSKELDVLNEVKILLMEIQEKMFTDGIIEFKNSINCIYHYGWDELDSFIDFMEGLISDNPTITLQIFPNKSTLQTFRPGKKIFKKSVDKPRKI